MAEQSGDLMDAFKMIKDILKRLGDLEERLIPKRKPSLEVWGESSGEKIQKKKRPRILVDYSSKSERKSPERSKPKNESSRAKKRTPFTKEIIETRMPRNFRPSVLKSFDGTGDPSDHMAHVNSMLDMLSMSDDQKCLVFPSTLELAARKWFSELPEGSIASWEELDRSFQTNFIGNVYTQKPPTHMMNIRQREFETLREYVVRFTSESNHVTGKNDKLMLTAFIGGLKPGYFNRSIHENYPTTYTDALKRAHAAIIGEESDITKKNWY